jgi:hypothetical protein
VSELPGVYAVSIRIDWLAGSYSQHTEMYRRPRTFTAPRR